MNSKEMKQLYLKAVGQALEVDHINEGYHVDSPFDFIPDENCDELENYLRETKDISDFYDFAEFYFFEVSHYSNTIAGMPKSVYRQKLVERMNSMLKNLEE